MTLSVRAFQLGDIEKIVDYFLNADAAFLSGMGADKSKLPKREDWIKQLELEFHKTYKQKGNFYLIWLLDGEAVGHSNINNIEYASTATMHLHLWKKDKQQSGLGVQFLKQAIPFYFEYFKLQTLICEPYSENIAPNKTRKKLGFHFIRCYETTPGTINFLQTVNRYELPKAQFDLST